MSEQVLPTGEGRGLSRRQFLTASAGAAALYGITSFTPGHLAGLRIASAAQVQLKSDLDILNFALTLEMLEDMAYQKANRSGVLTGRSIDIFRDFGDHEHTHAMVLADTIRSLGGQPVQLPSNITLPEFTSQEQTARFFAEVETVGTGADPGAAPMIKDKALLAAAASIVTVEAQHASVLLEIAGTSDPVPAFDRSRKVEQVMVDMPLLTMNQGKLPPPAGNAAPSTVGMPRTGGSDGGFPTALTIVAGLFAAATGALIHVRTRRAGEQEGEAAKE